MGRVIVLLVGLLAFAASTLAIWLLAEPALGATAGLLAALGESVGVPLVLAIFLVRSMRRQDPSTRFGSTVLGLTGGCAVVTLLVLGFVARGPLAHALGEAPKRHGLKGAVAWASRSLGDWIAPAPARPDQAPPPRPRRTRPDAGAAVQRDHGAPDAGSTAADAASLDAGARPSPAPAPSPRPAEGLTARVRVCDEAISAIFAVELGPQGFGEEIVVACDDGMRALWRLADGRVLERTRVVVHAPAGLELVPAEPRVLDLDEDGAPDLVMGAYYTTPRGGTRGGDTWWAPGQPDGQFGAPVRLVGGYCAGIDAGDVDGDGQAELVVVHVGNPWNPARPEGELRWFEREGRRFTQRGHQAVHRQPSGLWLTDVDHDGLLDAVVRHDWEQDDVVVLPGTPRGLGPIAEGADAPSAPGRSSVALRLDDDDRPDRAWAEGGAIVLEPSQRLTITGAAATRALDHRGYEIGSPPTP